MASSDYGPAPGKGLTKSAPSAPSALNSAKNATPDIIAAIARSQSAFDKDRETINRIIDQILEKSQAINTSIINATTFNAINAWVTEIVNMLHIKRLPEETATRSISTIKNPEIVQEKILMINSSFDSVVTSDIMITSGFDNDCLIHAMLQALSETFRTLSIEYKNAIASIFRRKILVHCVINTLQETDSNILNKTIYNICNLSENELVANNELAALSARTLEQILHDKTFINKFLDLCIAKLNDARDTNLHMKYNYLIMLIRFATTRLLTDEEIIYITNKYSFCVYVYDVASRDNLASKWSDIGNNCQEYILLYNPQDSALHYETICLLPNRYIFENDFIKAHFQPAKQLVFATNPAATSSAQAPPAKAPTSVLEAPPVGNTSIPQSLVSPHITPAASSELSLSTQIIQKLTTTYKATLNNDGSVKIYNTDGNELKYTVTATAETTPLTFTVKQILLT